MGNRSNLAGVVDQMERRKHELRKEMVVWIEDMEYFMGRYKTMPPTEVVLYPDLMDRAWGWSRLVIYDQPDIIVEWPEFIKYLKEYFNRNVAFLYTMSIAASYCLNEEANYRMIHAQNLTAVDVTSSDSIQERTICLLNSDDKSVAAVAGLLCMAEEANLLSSLKRDDCKDMSVFSNYIRQSALNLTHYQGSESDAIAAALLGMSKETNSVRNLVRRGNTDVSVQESECGYLRECICPLLEKLENYFSSEIAGIVDEHASLPSRGITVGRFKTDKSEKPPRDSTVVELKSDKSNAIEKPKDTNEHCAKNNHGNKKRKRSKKAYLQK